MMPTQPPLSTPIAADPIEADRAKFEETTRPPDLSSSDRLIRLDDSGEIHRERVMATDARADGVVTQAGSASETAFTLLISHALSDEEGNVLRDAANKPIIAPAHEVSFTADALGRLEEAGELEAAFNREREIAAANAARAFLGMRAGARLMNQFLSGGN